MMLIDLASASETAENLKTRLVTLGDEVVVSDHPTFSITYSGNSLMMRQKQSQKVYEYRGLTEAAATRLITLSSHGAARSIYYHAVGSDGDSVAVGVNVGTDNDYQMTRQGESNAFTVQRTETTWESQPVGEGWTTTRPTASGDGVVVSTSGTAQMVWAVNISGTIRLFNHTQKIEVKQYKFRTKAEADTLVANNTSYNATYQSYRYQTTGYYGYALTGTVKNAVSRYVDGDGQYTVDVTTTTLGGAWS